MTPVKATDVLGRYRIVRCIGRGGMGDVWLARYEALPGVVRLAALKVLRPELVNPSSSPAKVFEEARVNAYVSHANVVAVIDAGIDEGVAWLALEYVPGPTLRAIFDAAWSGAGGHVSPWLFAAIASRACAGLAAVHDAKSETGQPLSIIHRDVSPQNLLVSWDGAVKLLDFGIARSAIAAARTATGTIKGKLGYMAPEQVRGGQRVDKRADVFALGVVLWEALARRRLFWSEDESEIYELVFKCEVPPLAEIAPEVPSALAAIVHRALAADPTGRFWTALEMKQALDGAMMNANVSIGEPEIAASVARLLPDRVREHEGWLAEATREPSLLASTMLASVRDEPPPATERLAPKKTAPLAKPIRASSRPTPPAPVVATAPPPRPIAPIVPAPVGAPPSEKKKAKAWGTILLGAAAALFAIVGAVVVARYVLSKASPGLDASFASDVPSGVAPEGRVPATQEPATAPGTPESSQKAAPPWPARTITGDIAEYAPQIGDAVPAFMAAVPLGEMPVERSLVVCRIQTFGKADTLSGDDLQVRAVLGSTPLVANDGAEDANLAFVSAPLANLKKGDAVHFEVFDRDVFDLQAIEKVHTTWSGGPLATRTANATIECRLLSGPLEQKLVAIRAARADESTAKLAAVSLDGRTFDWGWPAADVKAARQDVSEIAALVGWDDGRARRRVTALDGAVAKANAKKPAVFDALYGAAHESATVAHVTITPRVPSCAADGAACTIRIAIRNDTDKALMRTGWAGVTAYAANRESGPEPASFDLHSMGGSLEPGATMDVVATPPRALVLGNGPAILGVCRESQCAAIRVH